MTDASAIAAPCNVQLSDKASKGIRKIINGDGYIMYVVILT
jgi:hypothetical protein